MSLGQYLFNIQSNNDDDDSSNVRFQPVPLHLLVIFQVVMGFKIVYLMYLSCELNSALTTRTYTLVHIIVKNGRWSILTLVELASTSALDYPFNLRTCFSTVLCYSSRCAAKFTNRDGSIRYIFISRISTFYTEGAVRHISLYPPL